MRGKLKRCVRVRLPQDASYFRMKAMVSRYSLGTVCVEAKCPNRWECYSRGVATLLIMGKVCARACSFCGIESGVPEPLDPDEPGRVALLVNELGLRYVVITSVTRDDLPDMGASHFRATVEAVKAEAPSVIVETLVPDFKGDGELIGAVLESGCDVFSHNMETVRRLFPIIRPGLDYERSLGVLELAGSMGAVTKSGIMLGLGEDMDEVMESVRDIKAAGCNCLTVGQYLRPRREYMPVVKFYGDDEFRAIADYARSLGFRFVASAPRVRSSYRVDCFFYRKADTIHIRSGRNRCHDTRS